ncbi:MAG: MBL fold metallo-hydrolase, partial [Thermoplasmata archaeon]|nr:MBL fold metallo-hydrolase [Thermoplasmata archaeon]
MAGETVPTTPMAFDERTTLLDVHMFGTPHFGGIYFIDEEHPTLIETGTSDSEAAIVRALDQLGVDPTTIENVIVTHIHLDHAGGAGFLLDKLPNATVYVHERGAPHLADPSRLLASAAKALGAAFPGYGTLRPIPEARMRPVGGGEVLDIGGRELEIVYSPGHARHHVCILDRSTRALYTGDSSGIYFPVDGRIIPTSPFPEFDLPTALETMERLEALRPEALLYSHYGPYLEAGQMLRDQRREYARWGRRAEQLFEEMGVLEA